MENILKLIGRNDLLFQKELTQYNEKLCNIIANSSFLVIGGAGSIGQMVVKEIFKRNPLKLHVVDISENNLVELVRDIRSSFAYIRGDFKTFALDIGSLEYSVFIKNDGNYDYVLNLSALKHVRSEKDPFTLMRMINVNILNTIKTLEDSIKFNTKKYFCVSTDKATNPVNMMGASKRIMEKYIISKSDRIDISTARFANVAFSDGSLLYSFEKRLQKRQPIVAPNDVKRYFVTPEESGLLCLMSCIFGKNREIFFPKLSKMFKLISFAEIAVRYLESKGYEPYLCKTEDEARSLVSELSEKGKWPCLFTKSDTSGEKSFEEFYTDQEILDLDRFANIGIVKYDYEYEKDKLDYFLNSINDLKIKKEWTKNQIISLFEELLPNFKHLEAGKNLDNKM